MKLKALIKIMDELRDELDTLRPIPEDRLNRLNQKLRLDWNYHSNSIEGNTLTASETRAFLLHGITSNGKPFRDYIEMRGHNEALKKLEDIVHQDLNITEKLIKEFHKIIVVEPYDGEAEINPGEYKTMPNYLYSPTGERIDFEPPLEVPRLLNELINWLNNHIDPPKRKKKKYDLHPLLIACGFHVRFIQIHPFGDGNGRMARILMNLVLMLCGYVPAVIKLEKRKEYYIALNQSTLENMEPLAEFVAEECIQSLEMAVKAAKGESIEEPEDLDKKIALLEKELEAVDPNEEVKYRLNKDVFSNIFHGWLGDLIKVAVPEIQKFNKFFSGTNHWISLANSASLNFINENPAELIDKLNTQLNEQNNYFQEHEQKSTINTNYGTLIKGGLKTFGCNFSIEIKFDTIKYEVLVDEFAEEPNKRKRNKLYERLLHKPLTETEIIKVVKQLTDAIYDHIDYNTKKNGLR